jgi:hypothetical protein
VCSSDLTNTDTRDTNLTKDQLLYMFGHPLGLPLKYTPDGQISKVFKDLINTNLDAFHGNSGSPVFSLPKNRFEGILIRGNPDFYEVERDGCKRPIPYDSDYPEKNEGEIVLRLSGILIKY